jgi:ribosomal protein S18 acetylase RimI-like enzyme
VTQYPANGMNAIDDGPIQADRWLSEMISRPAFRVDARSDIIDALVTEHARTRPGGFYFAKVPCKEVSTVRRLQSAGFFTCDTNVTFELWRDPLPGTGLPAGAAVRPFEPRDLDDVLEVAGSAFVFSRFHLDPEFPVSLAHTVKREWVRSCCEGRRGDRVFVATVEDRAVGFLAALTVQGGGRGTAVIDLIGVDKRHRGARLGSALVEAFVQHYRPRCDSLLVGTQVANAPSVRLYERMGFSLLRSEYVLHKHAGS